VQSLLDNTNRQCVRMVLTDATQGNMFLEKLFQTPLVVQELHEILFIPEFPCHIAGGPQSAKTIPQCFMDGIFQHCQHSFTIKLTVHQ